MKKLIVIVVFQVAGCGPKAQVDCDPCKEDCSYVVQFSPSEVGSYVVHCVDAGE